LHDNIEVSSLNTTINTKGYDGKIFNSSEDLHDHLEQKFEVQTKYTHLNPANHTISSFGELSPDVVLAPDDEIIEVYEGKNSLAYQDYMPAIETFYDSKKKYYVDVSDKTEFDSKEEAIMFLQKNKKEELMEVADSKEKLYYNGSLLGTESEIKS